MKFSIGTKQSAHGTKALCASPIAFGKWLRHCMGTETEVACRLFKCVTVQLLKSNFLDR